MLSWKPCTVELQGRHFVLTFLRALVKILLCPASRKNIAHTYQGAAQPAVQAQVGAHTNLVHLAQSSPGAAYEEYKRRQASAPQNVHTLLGPPQQVESAGRQRSQEASYLD